MSLRPLELAVLALIALVAAASRAQTLQVGLSFEGSNIHDSEPQFGDPLALIPDTTGAVGPDHIVEIVNGRYAVYRKSDGALLESSGTDRFWSDAGAHAFYAGDVHNAGEFANDPRVLYDAPSQRWFAAGIVSALPGYPVCCTFAPNQVLLAVSKTSDPTQGWTGFAFDSGPGGWDDFTRFGIDADGVYIATARVTTGDLSQISILGVDVIAIPKAQLLAPTPSVAGATRLARAGIASFRATAQPVVNLDGGGTPETLIAGELTNFGAIELSTVSGPITAPSYAGARTVLVDRMPAPHDADQPGSVPGLATSGISHPDSVVQRNGAIWMVQSALGDGGHDAVRWFQIDALTNTVLQAGVIEDPDLDLIYPSIAVNEFEEVVIGLQGASETTFASAYAVAGATAGGVTTFGDLVLLAAGAGTVVLHFPDEPADATSNWGALSTTVDDPSDPHSFWTFQEYAIGTDQWGTRIAQLHFVPEPGAELLTGAAAASLVACYLASNRARGIEPS